MNSCEQMKVTLLLSPCCISRIQAAAKASFKSLLYWASVMTKATRQGSRDLGDFQKLQFFLCFVCLLLTAEQCLSLQRARMQNACIICFCYFVHVSESLMGACCESQQNLIRGIIAPWSNNLLKQETHSD